MTFKTLPIMFALLALGSAFSQPCTPLATQIADGQIEVLTLICPTVVGTGTPFSVYSGSNGNQGNVPPFPIPHSSNSSGFAPNSASQPSKRPESSGISLRLSSIVGTLLGQSSSLDTTSSRTLPTALPSSQMGTHSTQDSGPRPVPMKQQPSPKAISIPTSVNMSPSESAQVWRPSGHKPSPSLVTSAPTTVSAPIDSLLPTSNVYPGQTAPFNGQLSPTTPPVTLSGGLVITPAVTIAPNAAKPALKLPNGALISAGGLPAIISGTTYSVLPSNQGLLLNGKSTLSIPQSPSNLPSSPIFTVGGQVLTASLGGFPLASTSLLPGGPPVTISGTVVSLGQGALQIDSTTVMLPTIPSNVLTVGEQVFTVAPTGFDISGMSILPGGHTVTVSGTPIFLDASSRLQIGPSIVDLRPWPTFPINTATSTTSLDLDLVTSTMTTLPPGFYTEVLKSTTLVGNMWLTTEKDGHSTIVPVVGGTILWNLPEIPHVSFQFPDLPSIPHFHLPCIKILGVHVSGDCPSGNNDNKNTNNEDNSGNTPREDKPTISTSKTNSGTSSASCSSSKVASNCNVICRQTASSHTCSTTCFSTAIGCNATGRTITATATMDHCLTAAILGTSTTLAKRGPFGGQCGYPCPATIPTAPMTGPLADTTTGPPNKRALGRRSPNQKVRKLGNCILTTPTDLPVNIPAYTGGYDFWKLDRANRLGPDLQAVSRYYVSTTVGDCTPTITSLAWGDWTPLKKGSDANLLVTTDHAYEINTLKEFFIKVVLNPQNGLDCAQMNALLFDTTCLHSNLIRDIFAALPSNAHPDFVIMSALLNNRAKGYLWGVEAPDFEKIFIPAMAVGPQWSWSQTSGAAPDPPAMQMIKDKLGLLHRLVLGCLTIKAPNVIDLVKRTNTRIYGAMLELDTKLERSSDPNAKFGFAAKYRSYMDNWATERSIFPSYIPRLIKSIEDDLKRSRTLNDLNEQELNQFEMQWQSFVQKYDEQSGTDWNSVNFAVSFTWQTNVARDPGGRAIRPNICALNSSSSSSPASSTITSTPLCGIVQNPNHPNGADGGRKCAPDTYCDCTSGSVSGAYETMTGSAICGWTTLPSQTWGGPSCSPTTTEPPQTGQYLRSETLPPDITRTDTIVIGCTSTSTDNYGPHCIDQTPISTINPVQHPTGAPAAPSCYPSGSCVQAAQDGKSTISDCAPDPAYFEAAVGVFCGDECHGQDGCRSVTGRTLDQTAPLWATGFSCSIAQAANSSLCCEPYNYKGYGGPYGPPFWPASGLNLNVALKLIGGTNCNWKVDRDTCVTYLRNAFNGCPFGGVDWNECVAWTVSVGDVNIQQTDALHGWASRPFPP